MQPYVTGPVKSEIHYSISEQSLRHIMSPTVEKVIKLCPKLILGESNLFNYDSTTNTLVLSPSFQNLLKLLVELCELDSKALDARSISDLNAVLQQAQGGQGGLLRKEGTERWHLEDNSTKKQYSQTIEEHFQKLGFVLPQSIDDEIHVDHCMVFGARVERMEARLINTVRYLQKNLKVNQHLFLLGSNRKLVQAEIDFLRSKWENLEESQKSYWIDVFNDPEHSTEANAFVFLWKSVVPQEIQNAFEKKLIGIKSTRIGYSYNTNQGHRATTEVTSEDWMTYYNIKEPQSIFALAEQPYIRLTDQLRMTVLTKSKKANLDELMERIRNTTFHFVSPKPKSPPLISGVLDEIGRSVYRTLETLKYLETLDSDSNK